MDIGDKYEENFDMEKVVDFPIDIVESNKIIQGEVVTIDNDFAYVNVGIKTDGRVSLEEFDIKPDIGDMIDVLLVNKRLIEGMYVFSKTAAEKVKNWSKFIELYDEGNEYIQGMLTGSNSKGMIIDCCDVDGFLPFSLAADVRGKKNLESNSTFWFKIISIDQKRQSILLSRKDYLDEENEKLWDNFVSKCKVDDKIIGKVNKFVEFGAFIEVEGIEGLLHKNDMSWKKVFKPKKLMDQGENREFIILNIDRDEGKISLGLKQLTEDPWLKVNEKYEIGAKVSGEIVTLTNFGAFVELEEGVDGFIDSSEISWTKKNVNPKDVFKKGQTVEAIVLDIKREEKKMPLGFKQVFPNPWDTIDERFEVGSVNKTKIKKIVNFGMFVELEDGIDGLIHVSDIAWDDNLKEHLKKYNVDNLVEYKILEIKKEEMKIACGIKQLTRSPWEIIKEKYPEKSKVTGVISGIVPFGIFVKIDEDVEGLVHISEVSRKRIENIADQFKVGDEVNTEVIGIDVERKRLSLSIKKFNQAMDKEELDKVLNDTSPKTATLGDFIKIKLGE